MGICFEVAEDKSKPFLEGRSIVPHLLPELADANPIDQMKLLRIWPKDPPTKRYIQFDKIIKFNAIPPELVSRLLASLSNLVQEDLIWKNALVLFHKLLDTQAYLRSELSSNQFHCSIRGSNFKSCQLMLTTILDHVTTASKGFPSIEWQEAVPSPHDNNASLSLIDLKKEKEMPLEKRQLVCPETHLPIHPELVLYRAGVIDTLVRTSG